MIDLQALNTIPDLMDAAAEAFGQRVAVEEGESVLSYKDLNRQRLKAAAALVSLGVEPGDRVAIWAPNISEWIVAAIGLQTVGAALVPLNTRMKGAEAAYILKASGARVLFCISQFLDCDYPAMLEEEDLPELETIVTFRGGGTADSLGWDDFLDRSSGISREDVRRRQAGVGTDTMSDLLL